MTSGPGQQQFNTFLQPGEAGIAAATYLGAAILGHFCPNFGFHFKPYNDVCTTKSNPTEDFTAKFLVSREARDYRPVTIEVHGNCWAPIPSLLTGDQLLTQCHHANTQGQSRAPSPTPPGELATPPQAAPAPAPPSAPDPILNNLPGTSQPPFDPFDGQHQVRTPHHAGQGGLPPPAHLPGLNQPFIPQQVQPFSPPPIRQSTPHMSSGDTPYNHSSRTLFHPPPPTSVSTLSSHLGPTPSRHFDYERASLENEETRRSANMEFLSICFLLAHPGPSHTIFDPVNRRPPPSAQNVFPREPCHHARREILSYLDTSRPALLHNSGRNYLAGILSANGIDFQQAYQRSFFTNQFFGSIINMESWLVSPHISPPAGSA
jgi:hypothetical protein